MHPEPGSAAPAAPSAPRKRNHLYVQVLIGIVLGGLLGYLKPKWGVELKPLGDAFVSLVKMLIGPIIFTTVVVGLAGMGDLKKIGRVGAKALIYFEVVTTLALLIGLVVANVFTPGAGFHADPTSLDASKVAKYGTASQQMSTLDFVLHIIPKTFVSAFAEGEILQVLLLAILFGLALGQIGEHGRPILNLLHEVARVFFGIVTIVTRAAPLAAGGAMAFTIGEYGVGKLAQLGLLMVCVYLTCVIFVIVVLGSIARLAGFGLWKIIRYVKEELLLVLGTSSSESALPGLMEKMEKIGCSRPVVGVVVPSGYSFNLDGTCIYLTMAALFLAQATDTALNLTQQFGLLGVLLLTSKGAAGVTGSGFIVLAATLQTTGTIPWQSMALIIGVDRFMSEARAITNFIGNTVATLVVAKWDGAFDESKAGEILAGRK
ncbi:dicarboxylate/amino acid:cation symporter [Horticoccus sp. 23ND18S-11]|uniref:dicarboxylate/amino acid:cation symporter n=1 Tax=Horticoccus sp. 23ND18S-11 TaxID=3391832 RepID=UPI0039C90323